MSRNKSKTKSRKKPQPPAREHAAKGGRVTAVEREERLVTTEALMLQGAPRSEILSALRDAYDIGPRGSDELVAQVRTRWAEEAEREGVRAQAKAAAVQRVSHLAYQARNEGNLAAAVSAERLLAQIEGTLAPAKSEEIDFTLDDFNRAGLRRFAKGEDPRKVLATGGAAGDPEPSSEGARRTPS